MKILLELVYWLPLPVRGLVLVVLVRRKFIQLFPVFFSYLIVSEAGGVARYIVYHTSSSHSTDAYPTIYWVTNSVMSAFALLATWELCGKRLFAGFQQIGFYRRIFQIAAVSIFAAGVVAGFMVVHGYDQMTIYVRFVNTVDGLRLAMLFFFVSLMVMLGRHWRSGEFGVAIGLSIEASSLLVTSSVIEKFPFFRFFPPIAIDLACILWLVTFLRASNETRPTEPRPIDPSVVLEAKKSAEALKSWRERRDRLPREDG